MKTCSIDGCNNKYYAKQLCSKHYQRMLNTGSTEIIRIRTCTIDGCFKPNRSLGLCSVHYHRKRSTGDPLQVAFIVGDNKKRLASSVIVNDAGCWEWQKSKWLGYGRTSYNGKIVSAHRASWMEHVGKIPDNMQINHKCHNKGCINPDHLYVGTQKDNMIDMMDAGREHRLRGEEHGSSILKELEVVHIKRFLAAGLTITLISKIFSISQSNIRFIKQNKTWAHVKS